jgi:hypothetical protein
MYIEATQDFSATVEPLRALIPQIEILSAQLLCFLPALLRNQISAETAATLVNITESVKNTSAVHRELTLRAVQSQFCDTEDPHFMERQIATLTEAVLYLSSATQTLRARIIGTVALPTPCLQTPSIRLH